MMQKNKSRAENSVFSLPVKFILCIFILFALISTVFSMPSIKAQEQDTYDIGIPVEDDPQLFVTRSMPTHGEGKIAVFLIDFPDFPNENPMATREYYDGLYFSGGVDTNWSQKVDSVVDFYAKQSYGKLNLSGEVFDWYTAKHERSYYDDRKEELIMEAAEHYMSAGVDFSRFDGDGDGVIDAITYHFAGKYSNSTDDPWYSGVTYSSDGYVNIDGKKITTLVQLYEGASADKYNILIAPICHELLHTLGMPDLYGIMGESYIIDLMSTNQPMINPYFKLLLGWLDMSSFKIVTEEESNITISAYGGEMYGKTGDVGEVAIITDEFNGLYDEFYMVVYLYSGYRPVVYRIDARLNEKKTAFLYGNLRYAPRPDRDDPHGETYHSLHLFMEELSSNGKFDYIFNNPYNVDQTAFGPDSVLGPNSLPSSDTHDGVYTGIKIDNFNVHNIENDKQDKEDLLQPKTSYLTFDVSFVEDTVSPLVTTSEDDLNFSRIIKVHFNEYIYKGENWENIRVTDIDGEDLNANIILTHYPHHEIEIQFNDDGYKRGYKLVFPDGAVCDSSENQSSAFTLTVSAANILLPTLSEQLPGTGECLRDNSSAYFFESADSLVVITPMWENHISDAKLEFMRLDYNGNVLKQVILDNPFDDSRIIDIHETGDGCYIAICCMDKVTSSRFDLLFCIDQNGELKWSNDTYFNSGMTLESSVSKAFKTEDGVVVLNLSSDKNVPSKHVCISSEDGTVSDFVFFDQMLEEDISYTFLNLSNQTVLMKKNGMIELIDMTSGEVIIENRFEGKGMILDARANGDGTILLFTNLDSERYIYLLDINLSIVKSVTLPKADMLYEVNWLGDDGLCAIVRTMSISHLDSQYHIKRYDMHLDLIWQSDVTASVLYFFKSPEGEILSYKSMLEPERECYIEHYASEDSMRTEHIHNIVHIEEKPSDCKNIGYAEHWRCNDCGCLYFDEGQTLIPDAESLILPLGDHIIVHIQEKPSDCKNIGYAEHWRCSDCGCLYFDEGQTLIPDAESLILPLGDHHIEVVTEPAREPACNQFGLTEGTSCALCKITLKYQEKISETSHNYGNWISEVDKRQEYCICTVCNNKLFRPLIETESPDNPSASNPTAPDTTVLIIGITVGASITAGAAVAAACIIKKKRK